MTFADFKSLLRDHTRQAWLDLLTRRPGERAFAFALVTDDETLGASAAADTIERRDQRLAKRPPRNAVEAKYRNWEFVWNTGEWDSIYSMEQPCAHPMPLLGFESMIAFRKSWLSNGGTKRSFRRKMLRTMVDVLADLDREGVFGGDSQREELTLFVEITDSADSELAAIKTARMLNPTKAARRLTRSLPPFARVLVWGMSIAGCFRRGRLIAGPSAR